MMVTEKKNILSVKKVMLRMVNFVKKINFNEKRTIASYDYPMLQVITNMCPPSYY